VFDFPAGFSEEAARRLVSIAQNGARCGVHTIVHYDPARPLPYGFNVTDLVQGATVIRVNGDRCTWDEPDVRECLLELDVAPPPELVRNIVTRIGEGAQQAARVQVPFDRIAPASDQWWTRSSATSLQAPLGPAGARRTQELMLGRGTSQHVLIAGKTGSGKSTLLHTLITSLALNYSPDEVRLYLIDFKKGVEFKTYAQHELPHARVIAVESEREFGLSVLQGLDDELKRRGELFRAAGVDAIGEFRARTGEKLPRILLLVDEFQEFFTEDDQTATQAAHILDRLVRQGRAFGVHVVLGSQTLAGAYSLARSTVDQMAVRIALQCSEADSRLILADDNPAARLLSRPGEAIYNAANGMVEGNNTFQVAWLPDEQRDHYLQALALMRAPGAPTPLVFEGNAPADLRLNRALVSAVENPVASLAAPSVAWLGDPVAIREPAAVRFRRQSGSNLLIVGQDEGAALGVLTSSLISLAAPTRSPLSRVELSNTAQFQMLDFSVSDGAHADYLARLASLLQSRVRLVRRRQLTEALSELESIIRTRLDTEHMGTPLFLVVNGLQRARDLRQEDTFNFGSFGAEKSEATPAQLFSIILRDGPEADVHTIVWCDTMTNLARTIDRRTQREFALRVAFQMGTEDSSNLIDSTAATRLGAYRALLFNEDEGRLEKFRPYASPSEDWLQSVCGALRAAEAGLTEKPA
jgi:S-DNA-T family DNA segregation ATPase FtsK/SpoIIIE